MRNFSFMIESSSSIAEIDDTTKVTKRATSLVKGEETDERRRWRRSGTRRGGTQRRAAAR